MDDDELSELVKSKLPCPCGTSSDAYALYSDGHGFCFSCQKPFKGEGETIDTVEELNKGPSDLLRGDYQALNKRRITLETCRKYGYFVSVDSSGRTVQVANYYTPGGHLIGQKVRPPDKAFYSLGYVDKRDFQIA